MLKFQKSIIFLLTLSFLLVSCGKSVKQSVSTDQGSFVTKYMKASQGLKADPVLDMSPYPDKRFNPNKFSDCAASLDPYACYLTVTYNTYKSLGLDRTLASLEDSDIKSNSDCYRVSKGVGALLTSLEPEGKKLELLTSNYSACPPSFVEGVYDQVFGSLDFDSLSSKAPEICMNLPKDVSWACHYYLGRALMNFKLPDPEKAASACMSIPSPDDSKGNHKTMRRSCLSGAWQTFFRDKQVLEVLKTLNPTAKNIFEFCLTDMSSSKDVCLQEDSPAFWQLPGLGDITSRFEACGNISADRNEIDQCYFGMGRGVSDANQRDNKKIVKDCALLLNEQDSDYCFIASGEALNNRDFTEGVNGFCGSLSPKIEEFCFRAIGMQAFGQMGGDHTQAIEICKKVNTAKLRDRCVEGVYAAKNRVGFVHTTSDLTAESIYAPCLNSDYIPLCYRNSLTGSGKFYKSITGKELMVYCSKIKTSVTSDCYIGVGRAAGVYEKDSESMLKVCSGNADCQRGLAESIGKRENSLYEKVCQTQGVECVPRKSGQYF